MSLDSIAVSKPARRKWLGLGPIGWAVGIVVTLGMLVSILLPSLCQPRETANRVKCQSNLSQIGKAIALYTQGNGGQYPPSLAALMVPEELTPAVMICPSGVDQTASSDIKVAVADIAAAETGAPDHKHCLSYIYVGHSLTAATATAGTIVAYERLENHNQDGTNALFGDGHAEWVDKRAWLSMADRAGMKVGSSDNAH